VNELKRIEYFSNVIKKGCGAVAKWSLRINFLNLEIIFLKNFEAIWYIDKKFLGKINLNLKI